MDIQVLINIHIVDSNKEELLIDSNWIAKYKADLILSENKLKFQAQNWRFEVKIINVSTKKLLTRMNWFRKDQSDIISLDDNEEDAKTEYTIEEVDDWLNRVWTFRGEKVSNKLLGQ